MQKLVYIIIISMYERLNVSVPIFCRVASQN
jgi:hypothetical protein